MPPTSPRPPRWGRAVTAATVAVATACGTTSCAHTDPAPAPATVTVFAAASLTRAFQAIADEVVPTINPNLKVDLTFEGSTTLAEQLEQGAPADVVALANQAVMDRLVKEKLVTDPTDFATNSLAILVPEGNPDHVTGFNESLNKARLVICAPQVPCGAAAQSLAKKAGITLKPVSEEHNVNLVRTKVEQGEATAGLVYTTDAAIATGTTTVPRGAGLEAVKADNIYPIAAVTGAPHSEAARTFITAVESPAGQKVLARFGFGQAS